MSYQGREHPLSDRRDDDFFTIYVNNLPAELNEDGIAQIFKSYGEICSLFTPPNAHWAYVSYKNYKEAEHAIRALNECSPLYLKVAFRKKKVQPKTQRCIPTHENGAPIEQRDYRYAQNEIPHIVDSRRIMPGALAINMARMSNNPAIDVNSVYPTDPDQNVYNPFESTGRYADTNAMWSRGCVNIDEYGKRYVSMGRGYTRYHIPEPDYLQIEHNIGRVYEKRRAGFYQYGEDRLNHEIGKCLYCGHPAKHRCGRCDAYYCSRECQVGDWLNHKIECKNIPPLVGEFEAAGFSCSSNDEPIQATRKPRVMVELGPLSSLRRPKRATNMGRMKNSVEPEKPTREIPIDEISHEIRAPRRGELIEEESIVVKNYVPPPIVECARSRESSSRHDASERVEVNSENKSPQISENLRQHCSSGRSNGSEHSVKSLKLTKTEQDLCFQMDSRSQTSAHNEAPLCSPSPVNIAPPERREISTILEKPKITASKISSKNFENVRVIFLMPDETFWVNRSEDIARLETMMLELNERANNYPKVSDLVVGEIYAVQYENYWHRALLLEIKPAIISYIDFGNVESPQTQDFRILKDFKAEPAFGIHVRLSATSRLNSVDLDGELSVKMIGTDDNGIAEIIVNDENISPKARSCVSKMEIASEKVETTMEIPELKETRVVEKSLGNLPNMIDSFDVDGEGFVQVYVALDNNSYAVCVLSADFMEQYQMIYERLTDVCNALEKPKNFIPKIGDFVCGKRDDSWLRGYVFSLGPPIRLALVDEARVTPVTQVLPMPSDYENVCSFGTIIHLDNAGKKFNVNETGEFRVTGIVNEAGERIVKAVLSSPDYLKDVCFTMKNWKPTSEQKGISSAELKNNSEVFISSYSSERIMYVRSLDNASLERTQRLIQDIAKWAQKAPMLKEPPVIGQLVIAKFGDGNYYRAIVTKLLDDKIGVSYVDYGNAEITTIDRLRLLSDELKEERSCVTKIILKDIKVGEPPTKEVHQYLDLLVGKEESFICTFEGIPSKDGVTLTTATGECVNDKVNTFLTPVWQREDPSRNKKCFMLDDLEIASLGEVGHIIKALPLFATDPPFKYVMAPFDKEHITHVTGIMPELILKYCESTKDHYIPRTNELCLGVWEGAWYRGACLNRNATPTQALIYFVDFGNEAIVDHTDIRQMTKDFMVPAALGLSCVVKNLGIQLVNGKVPENVQRRTAELIQVNELIDVKIIKASSPKDEIPLAGDYEIELPTVRETLVAEGLVKP